jgi:hypothetical protein
MTARTIAGLAGAAALMLAVRSAAAQECPVAQIGQACDAGACIQATCTNTDVDGSTTVRSCGACIDLGPNSCPPGDVGKPCDGGGVCSSAGGGGGGGPVGGGGPSFQIMYSLGICSIPSDGGGGSLGRGGGGTDASAAFGTGDDASAGAGSSDDAAAHSQTAPGSKEAFGCAMSSGETGRLEPIALIGATAVLLRRRTKSGTRRWWMGR